MIHLIVKELVTVIPVTSVVDIEITKKCDKVWRTDGKLLYLIVVFYRISITCDLEGPNFSNNKDLVNLQIRNISNLFCASCKCLWRFFIDVKHINLSLSKLQWLIIEKKHILSVAPGWIMYMLYSIAVCLRLLPLFECVILPNQDHMSEESAAECRPTIKCP